MNALKIRQIIKAWYRIGYTMKNAIAGTIDFLQQTYSLTFNATIDMCCLRLKLCAKKNHKYYKTALKLFLTQTPSVFFSCFLLLLFPLVIYSSWPAGLFFSLWSGWNQYGSLNPFYTLTWSCNRYKIESLHILLIGVHPLNWTFIRRHYLNHLLHQCLDHQ